LSHFELITVVPDEAWKKLRRQNLTMLKLPLLLLRIEREPS
jgi:hypothetical protein